MSTSSPAVAGPARPTGPRSGRGSGRSTTGARPGGSGPPTRCPGSRPGPSRGGCGGTRGRVGPSWRSPPTGSRPPVRTRVGPLVPGGLDVVVGVAVRVGGQRGARLHGQGVGAQVGRRVGPGPARRPGSAPSRRRVSPAPPMIRSMFQLAEPGRGHRGGRLDAPAPVPWRRPRPASTWGTVDWTPSEIRVTPAGPVGGQPLRGDVLGIALHGDLGARPPGARRRGSRPAVRPAAGTGCPRRRRPRWPRACPSSARARPISVTQAAAYASIRWSRSV